MKKTAVIVIILLAVAATGFGAYRFWRPRPAALTRFKTEAVVRTDVLRTISATGTVEPEELINVGAQVNGKIMAFGIDADGKKVDYGSRVTEGMVLAQIDDVIYKAELQEAEAQKEQALAAIMNAEGAIREAEAKHVLDQSNYGRAERLLKTTAMSQSDYDSAKAALATSAAAIIKAKASLNQARAALSIAEAGLIKAKRNLEYCVITAPVDGIIIDRRVSIGQTVVSNQTASSIFLVAKDFRRMQVWVAVNEADIGNIKPGLPVRFSCDAFPGVVFRGSVRKVRMNATLSSNVVTYIVEVDADNADRKLVPYLTANVRFVLAERPGVLTVSSAALRYRPAPELLSTPAPEKLAPGETVVYFDAGNGKLSPATIKTGLANGQITEISGDRIAEDAKIVTGSETVIAAAAGSSDAKSPFIPTMPRRTGTGGGQRTRGGAN
ncbi:MAG: efflux RND transporter periplasmic adaptor subunit [Victivallaceae bacterium]